MTVEQIRTEIGKAQTLLRAVAHQEAEEEDFSTEVMKQLKMRMNSREAVATDFEKAISIEGLTMEVIYLIKTYYTDEDYPESCSGVQE